MSKIALVRHGETDYNKNRIIQGRIDIPLNENGKLQALKTAEYFKNKRVDLMISSPLVRAKVTSQIIAEEIHYNNEILIDEAFIERNFGDADGKEIDHYINLVHQEKIVGLEDSKVISARMINGIINVCQKHPEKNIVIVCHSHSIKGVLAALEPEKYDFKINLVNCGITLLEYKNKVLSILRPSFNDYI